MLNKQTTLDLNGPILSFTTNPVGAATTNGGSVTFTGIATATFPIQTPPNPAIPTGYISYRWYDQNGPLTDGANVTGSATTTLTISNVVSPTDHNKQFYLNADYIPSAYGENPITVGTARSTGNAINDPISSSSAVLTVYPTLSVTKQPGISTIGQNSYTRFVTNASITDTSQGNISYQWQLNGSDLSDSATIQGSKTNELLISLPNIGINTVRAKITHPTASNSPLYTNNANLEIVAPRKILNVEVIPDDNSTEALLYSWNIVTQGPYTINPDQVPPGSILTFYAPELLEQIMELLLEEEVEYLQSD
jgi:hypothetical protein